MKPSEIIQTINERLNTDIKVSNNYSKTSDRLIGRRLAIVLMRDMCEISLGKIGYQLNLPLYQVQKNYKAGKNSKIVQMLIPLFYE